MNRIPSLDGIRAISIVLVVLGHWAELRYHSDIAGAFANLGVRIFFILSGYLITTLLLEERDKTRTINLRKFYIRRAYRILPAAFAFMLVTFAFFWHDLRWYHMAAAALYVTNFDFSHPWFLGHLWSLSVEEQFYLLWPGVLRKWYAQRVWIVLGVIAMAPLFRIATHVLGLHGRSDETFPAVADILAFGCLLAFVSKRIPNISSRMAVLTLVPVMLVPIYVGVRHFHITAMLLFVWWPLMHTCIAGLILHAVRRPYFLLNIRPAVWLGQISYSLYLWQQLFVFGEHPRPWYSAVFAVAAASASYYLIEQPMLRLRERSRDRRKPAVTMAAAA